MASKNNRPIHPDAAADAIIKVLEPLTYARNNSQVFGDWIAVVEASLVMLPHHAISLAAGQGFIQDPAPVQALWARLNQTYSRDEWNHLQEAFALLVGSTQQGQSIEYRDTLGEIFMHFGAPNERSGQYFTPNPVAKMMGQILLNGTEVERDVQQRLRRAILGTPVGEALYMAWLLALAKSGQDEGISAFSFFAERIFPLIQDTYQPYTIADPCCGSGVLLMGAIQELPAWLIQCGLVEFHAFDVDERCCRMTHVNLMLYGASSYVIRHRNSLSLDPDFTPPRYGMVRWLTPPEVVPPQPDPTPAAPPVRLPDLDLSTHTQLTLNL